MEFEVRFLTDPQYSKPVVWVSERETGYESVLRIRWELAVNLPLDRIARKVEDYYDLYYDAVLKEDLVEDLYWDYGLFAKENTVKVFVPEKFLNQFVREVVSFTRNDETGEIKRAWIKRQVDEDKLIKSWIAAGAPLCWGFEEEAS